MNTIMKTLQFFTLVLMVLFIVPSGLAGQDKQFVKAGLLYESKMNTPESLKGWKMEGPGKVEFPDGWMQLYSPGQQMHHVYWCPQDFPGSFIAEWDAQNLGTDTMSNSLCIIFFAAMGETGEDIFDPNLPERDGTFNQYTLGKIISYHISYYANIRGHANLRKNNKFILVQEGKDGIPARSEKIHKLRLIKDGPHIVMFVDDRRIIDWIDDGKTYGPVYAGGKMGFRQMKNTHFQYRNFRVWSLQQEQP
jgi:hypothetical protein